MDELHQTSNKKNSLFLLFGIGISTLGDFIYLVAINILILKMTESPAAVAGLWIISPIASTLTKFWAGSLIDRMNQRNLMIFADILRAVLVAVIPFLPSVWLIYGCLFLLSIAKAFFEPTSMTYISKLVPNENRKQFNSFRSLITSGAFLVGPAIAGFLLLITSANLAIWINAISFLFSALMLGLLPNVEKVSENVSKKKITFQLLRQDWIQVIKFSKENSYIAKVFFLAQIFWIIALGMDAQEVVFTQKVLGLSETDYGLLISITGIGALIGSSTVSIFARKLSIRVLISLGYIMTAAGYLTYSFSFSFLSVAIGFMILGFFNSFCNTGFMTFYQNNVPLEIIGRISSAFGLFQSILQIGFVLLIGFTGETIPLRYSVIGASILVFCSSLLLSIFVYQPSRKKYYFEHNNDISS